MLAQMMQQDCQHSLRHPTCMATQPLTVRSAGPDTTTCCSLSAFMAPPPSISGHQRQAAARLHRAAGGIRHGVPAPALHGAL